MNARILLYSSSERDEIHWARSGCEDASGGESWNLGAGRVRGSVEATGVGGPGESGLAVWLGEGAVPPRACPPGVPVVLAALRTATMGCFIAEMSIRLYRCLRASLLDTLASFGLGS